MNSDEAFYSGALMTTDKTLYTVTFLKSGNKYLARAGFSSGTFVVIDYVCRNTNVFAKGHLIEETRCQPFEHRIATEEDIGELLITNL
jgi:hypothetical protein